MMRLSINNFRCMFGQKKHGVQFGGDLILQTLQKLKTVQKLKKTPYIAPDININSAADYRTGYNIVKHNLQKQRFNINLGGDHSIAAATIQPLVEHYKNDLLVIWIDAHADLNTYNSSLTKNIHGMPVGALTGLMEHWYKVNNKEAKLDPQNLIYVGIRDLDAFEVYALYQMKIVNFPTYEQAVIEAIKQHPAKHIHISCDIDSMDPTLMPSTGTVVPQGLTVKHVLKIINAAKPRLVGFDLVEFNPQIGNKRQVRTTLTNIHKILTKVIG